MTQARIFAEVVDVTGIVLTKLDGSAKGGIVVQVQRELGVPVKLVGLGEGADDLAPFDAEVFVDALLEPAVLTACDEDGCSAGPNDRSRWSGSAPGSWAADWGEVSEPEALSVLDAAVEAGVTFFDTADVYGDGRSEQLIGRFLADHPDLVVTVATKMGRRVEQRPENYTLANFRAWLDRSRRNLRVDQLDLVQLHCPPTSVYSHDEVYDALDTLVAEGVIAAYGVSVETCDEALTAISRRGTATVQIILNAFRHKPLDVRAAGGHGGRRRASSPGCRWPAACSAGGTPTETEFARERPPQLQPAGRVLRRRRDLLRGRLRDRGRGGAGVQPGWCAIISGDVPPAQAALAWVVQQPGVTTVIPGARSPEQARANAAAGSLPRAAGSVPGRRGRPLRPPAAGQHPPPLVAGAR